MLKAALLGYPVAQSLSPLLHGHWLKSYQINGSYEAIEVAPNDFAATITQLQREGYRGVNVTIPHKETAFSLVNSLCPNAQAIGAVNTIVMREDGALHGMNTDAYGFITSLKMQQIDLNKALEHCFILGAGGAAKAVYYALKQAGAKTISISNRSAEKLAGFEAKAVAWDKKDESLHDVSLLVNTTSLGMRNQPPLAIDLSTLPKHALVADIVYKPLQTALLKQAASQGNPIMGGLGMLIYQAAPAFEAWFGQEPAVTPELFHLLESTLL